MFINLDNNVTINTDDISSAKLNPNSIRCTYIISMRNGDKHIIPHLEYLQKIKPILVKDNRNVCL